MDLLPTAATSRKGKGGLSLKFQERRIMPNRIIKESICYSDDIDKLTPFEETVFYRLIVRADDFGRLDARPNYLKNTLFVTKPGVTEKSVSDAILKLSTIGLVQLYEVDEKPFLTLTKWDKHQTRRAATSKYPAPEDGECKQMKSDEIICKQVQADVHVFENVFENEVEDERARARGNDVGPFGLTADEVANSMLAMKQVEDAAKSIGLPFALRDAQRAEQLIGEYGLDWLLQAIERTSFRERRSWGTVMAILRSWQEKGGIDDVIPESRDGPEINLSSWMRGGVMGGRREAK